MKNFCNSLCISQTHLRLVHQTDLNRVCFFLQRGCEFGSAQTAIYCLVQSFFFFFCLFINWTHIIMHHALLLLCKYWSHLRLLKNVHADKTFLHSSKFRDNLGNFHKTNGLNMLSLVPTLWVHFLMCVPPKGVRPKWTWQTLRGRGRERERALKRRYGQTGNDLPEKKGASPWVCISIFFLTDTHSYIMSDDV